MPKILYHAMRYSIFNGGKRIRPILCMMAYDATKRQKSKFKSQNYEEILPFACGLEMIHTFSLIQDDLPCMDDDDLRRGKPSLHKQYNEAVALLTADVLFAKAFDLFAQAPVTDQIKVRTIAELADICGVNGLAAGQMMDILYQNKKLKTKNQKLIDQKKTAKLIAGSMKIGAIVAGAPQKTIKDIEKASINLGLLFQITDDILDKAQDSKVKSQKFMAEKYARSTILNFKKIGGNFSDFITLTNAILNRNA
ncbi:MAG: polyprenyl synthetase family protein [Candidatus Latescibacteria bacterium]|nr:polyprenyl synthetase family protein [Candidatus Latescibacterota bacterium]